MKVSVTVNNPVDIKDIAVGEAFILDTGNRDTGIPDLSVKKTVLIRVDDEHGAKSVGQLQNKDKMIFVLDTSDWDIKWLSKSGNSKCYLLMPKHGELRFVPAKS